MQCTEKIACSCTQTDTDTLRVACLCVCWSDIQTHSTPSSDKEIASANKSPAVPQICTCVSWVLLRFCRATQFPEMKITTSDCANSL